MALTRAPCLWRCVTKCTSPTARWEGAVRAPKILPVHQSPPTIQNLDRTFWVTGCSLRSRIGLWCVAPYLLFFWHFTILLPIGWQVNSMCWGSINHRDSHVLYPLLCWSQVGSMITDFVYMHGRPKWIGLCETNYVPITMFSIKLYSSCMLKTQPNTPHICVTTRIIPVLNF